MPSIGLDYREQGRIFFQAQSYDSLSEGEREKIRAVCRKAGGPEYGRAIFDYMTTGRSWQEITMEYHLSDRTLQRLRAKFYKLWQTTPGG